ncbi:hypothetical protein GCM10028814_03400 [Angustibacter aerolatus]
MGEHLALPRGERVDRPLHLGRAGEVERGQPVEQRARHGRRERGLAAAQGLHRPDQLAGAGRAQQHPARAGAGEREHGLDAGLRGEHEQPGLRQASCQLLDDADRALVGGAAADHHDVRVRQRRRSLVPHHLELRLAGQHLAHRAGGPLVDVEHQHPRRRPRRHRLVGHAVCTVPQGSRRGATHPRRTAEVAHVPSVRWRRVAPSQDPRVLRGARFTSRTRWVLAGLESTR